MSPDDIYKMDISSSSALDLVLLSQFSVISSSFDTKLDLLVLGIFLRVKRWWEQRRRKEDWDNLPPAPIFMLQGKHMIQVPLFCVNPKKKKKKIDRSPMASACSCGLLHSMYGQWRIDRSPFFTLFDDYGIMA